MVGNKNDSGLKKKKKTAKLIYNLFHKGFLRKYILCFLLLTPLCLKNIRTCLLKLNLISNITFLSYKNYFFFLIFFFIISNIFFFFSLLDKYIYYFTLLYLYYIIFSLCTHTTKLETVSCVYAAGCNTLKY